MYNPAVAEFLRSDLELVDYVSIIPDMFWTDRGTEAAPRFAELDSWVDILDWVAARRPLISHNIGLSLGSADLADDPGYVEQLAAWHRRYSFPWHSDHLSFFQVRGAHGQSESTGLAVPLPFDFEVLDLVSARIERLLERVKTPFLIENGVYYITFVDQDLSEAEFLNRLARRTGCGLLLDVHNLYANARNHGFDASEFVTSLDLTRVVEVHVAGGNEFAGMYTDSHAGACPDAVWSLLDEVVPRAPNLRGITFEFHDSYFPHLETEGLRAQLQRARTIWRKHRA